MNNGLSNYCPFLFFVFACSIFKLHAEILRIMIFNFPDTEHVIRTERDIARQEGAIKILETYKPDIVGFQEIHKYDLNQFARKLPRYNWVGKWSGNNIPWLREYIDQARNLVLEKQQQIQYHINQIKALSVDQDTILPFNEFQKIIDSFKNDLNNTINTITALMKTLNKSIGKTIIDISLLEKIGDKINKVTVPTDQKFFVAVIKEFDLLFDVTVSLDALLNYIIPDNDLDAILYDKEKLTVLAWDTFWLNEYMEPNKAGWDAYFKRTCTWAQFIINKTGKTFWIFNTHIDHSHLLAKENQPLLIAKVIKEKTKNYQDIAFFIGDLNFGEQGYEYQPLIADPWNLSNTKYLTENRQGPIGATYIGWDESELRFSYILDHLLTNAPERIKVLKYEVIDYTPEFRIKNYLLGDHRPVMIEVEIPDK